MVKHGSTWFNMVKHPSAQDFKAKSPSPPSGPLPHQLLACFRRRLRGVFHLLRLQDGFSEMRAMDVVMAITTISWINY